MVHATNLESENFELKEIINNSWDGICIIDKQTKLVYVNDALSPMLGYQKEELLNSIFLDFLKHRFKALFLKLLKDNIKDSYNTDINLVALRKDKQKIYLKLTVSLMLNKKYFVVNAKDITKEISDDEILNNYVLSIHSDTQGKINRVSKAFCKLSGYTKEELIGTDISSYVHDNESSNIFNDILAYIGNKKYINTRVQFLTKKEESYYVDLKMKPIYNKYGDITGFTMLMFDVTTEILLDKKLSIENSKLKIMSNTIKTISHEWRQPLNAISLKAQNLQFNAPDEQSVRVLEEIKNKVKELSNTIEDFHNTIKIKSTKTNVLVQSLIQDSIDEFNNLRNSEINFQIENNIDTEILIFSRDLLNICLSLYQNSLDAFIKNDIKKPLIKINTFIKNNFIHFIFEDNAQGIDKEILDKVFEPYFSTKQQRHGVGLGLYMSKTIIETHFGGSISLKNKNDGLNIDIKIPL